MPGRDDWFSFEGFQFGGASSDVIVEVFDPGEGGVRTQDTPRPGASGKMMGRDYPSAPSWTVELATNLHDINAALSSVANMGALWRSPRWSIPGERGWLRYSLGSHSRRVIGRPRRFTPPNGDVKSQQGVARFMCDFQLSDPRTFSDAEHSTTLDLVPESTGGIIFPLAFPMTTTITGGVRSGFVTNAGDAPAPVTVTFHGPVANPRVFTPAWEVGIRGSLAYDESVTVDALAMTVKRQ